MAKLELHPAAVAEMEESADWYAEHSQPAAQGFALALDVALEKIEADPERFPQIDRRHRTCSLERYPFQVIFRKDDDRIFVIAIAHAKRRPGYWRDRS